MTYLTDEYWKKERQKERSKKRQQEMKARVMRVHKEKPELSINDIAELLGTTQRVVKNCLGVNIVRKLEGNSEIKSEVKDVKKNKGVKLTKKRIDGIVAKRDEQILKMHEEDIPANVIAEKLRMELGQVLEVFYRHNVSTYTKSELEEIKRKKNKKEDEIEEVTSTEDILRIMRKYNAEGKSKKLEEFVKRIILEVDFLTEKQIQNLQQIIDTISNRRSETTKQQDEEVR